MEKYHAAHTSGPPDWTEAKPHGLRLQNRPINEKEIPHASPRQKREAGTCSHTHADPLLRQLFLPFQNGGNPRSGAGTHGEARAKGTRAAGRPAPPPCAPVQRPLSTPWTQSGLNHPAFGSSQWISISHCRLCSCYFNPNQQLEETKPKIKCSFLAGNYSKR